MTASGGSRSGTLDKRAAAHSSSSAMSPGIRRGPVSPIPLMQTQVRTHIRLISCTMVNGTVQQEQ